MTERGEQICVRDVVREHELCEVQEIFIPTAGFERVPFQVVGQPYLLLAVSRHEIFPPPLDLLPAGVAPDVRVLGEGRGGFDRVLDMLVRLTLHEQKTVGRHPVVHPVHPTEVFRRDLAFREHLAHTYPVYVKAKQQNDYASFAPYLERIITYNRNLTKYLEQPGKTGYDVLLDRFEPGFLKRDYDGFFDLLRRELVPFAAKINASKLEGDFSFGKKTYPREEQIRFCEYLRDVMCVDRNHSVMRESEHPFTTGFGTDDIRITNHYYEDNLPSAIFSAIHESGHGLYMAQVDPTLNDTLSWDGASMAMHESQSRFYENMIGRSPLFWKVHYPKLKETFPEQLRDVPQETFIRYINQSGYSFIRTEADELTYPLHIMLRYEVEKAVVEEGLRAEDIPAFWNERFRDYFGMTPPTDTLGVLQDVHWATGEFGYFPTYALGSAYAAQIYAAMERDLDVEKALSSGTTREINEWLREHIHRYGASKYPKEILKLATGEEFDPGYYVDYLVHKFTEVYGV